jgi:hypothetical protein
MWGSHRVKVRGGLKRGRARARSRHCRRPRCEEKADALQRLATLVETILNPPDNTNVVDLEARR